MIVLLGGTGYIGRQFAAALAAQGWPFVAPSRAEMDYTRFVVRAGIFGSHQAGFSDQRGRLHRQTQCGCLRAEPGRHAPGQHALSRDGRPTPAPAWGIPWGHVSSGCIYTGAKVDVQGRCLVEKDLTQPELAVFVAPESRRFSRFHRRGRAELSPFAGPRAAFTAAPRPWARRPSRAFGQKLYLALAHPV